MNDLKKYPEEEIQKLIINGEVSVGDIVKVKVIKIDMERKKVGLSMKV